MISSTFQTSPLRCGKTNSLWRCCSPKECESKMDGFQVCWFYTTAGPQITQWRRTYCVVVAPRSHRCSAWRRTPPSPGVVVSSSSSAHNPPLCRLFLVMSFGPSFCRPFLYHVFWPVVLPAFSLSCLLAGRFAGLFFVMSFGPSFCRPFLNTQIWKDTLPCLFTWEWAKQISIWNCSM